MIPETEIAKMKERVEQNYPNTLTLATAFSAAKEDVKSLLSKIEEQERELVRLCDGWVSDKPPGKDAGYVLIFVPDNDGILDPRINVAMRDSGDWFGSVEQWDAEDVTHWRELPAPPVMEKQGVPVVDVPKVG